MARKKKSSKKPPPGFVLDGSVALAWCFTDEADAYADAVARKLPKSAAMVPALWHLEVANALLVGERRGRCDQGDTLKWSAFLASLPITVDEHNGERVFRDVLALARAQKLSVYDAAYVELALRRGVPLASLDGPLKNAAASVGVQLFDPTA